MKANPSNLNRPRKIAPQTPARITWEEAVLRHIIAAGVCRSDAQSIVEVDPVLLDSLYSEGAEASIAAQRFLDKRVNESISRSQIPFVKVFTVEQTYQDLVDSPAKNYYKEIEVSDAEFARLMIKNEKQTGEDK